VGGKGGGVGGKRQENVEKEKMDLGLEMGFPQWTVSGEKRKKKTGGENAGEDPLGVKKIDPVEKKETKIPAKKNAYSEGKRKRRIGQRGGSREEENWRLCQKKGKRRVWQGDAFIQGNTCAKGR